MTIFPTPEPETIASLLKQLSHFVRPSGKKPALPFAPPDMSRASGSPSTPREGMTPAGSDGERPRERSRTTADGDDKDEAEDPTVSPRQGKKPAGGKTAGKGTKPRTVVRGARGLVPMETDAAGDQHIAGRLPDNDMAGEDQGEAEDEDEDEDEDIPLAKRPQLEESERRRREVIKEKEKEREDEVVRRLASGSNVEDGAEGLGRTQPGVAVEVWEGVELVSLLGSSLKWR